MKKRIGEICQDFTSETAIYMAPDTVRHYEKCELFSSSRDKDNDYREYSDDEQTRIRKVLMLRELGVTIEDIQKDDTIAISRRVKAMEYILNQVKKLVKES